MATQLQVGDIVRVVYGCFCAAHTQQGLFRLYYKVVTPGTETVEALPDDLYGRMRNALLSWLPSQAAFVGVSAQRTFPLPITAKSTTIYTTGIAGIAGSGILPLQVSGLISFKTVNEPALVPPLDPTDGRAYIPFPAIASNDSAGAKLSTSGVAKLIQVGSLIGPSVVYAPKGLNMKLVVKRSTGVYSDVNSMTFHRSYATQRRRGDFGKINISFGGID